MTKNELITEILEEIDETENPFLLSIDDLERLDLLPEYEAEESEAA